MNETKHHNLDGRRFVMVSSTASRVDPDSPTQFVYQEADGVIWGSYDGDTVAHGRFVGTRQDDQIELNYVHLTKGGPSPVAGRSTSRIEALPDGRLKLVEEFQFEGDDTPQVSVCEELPFQEETRRADS
ncbi:hypothetical protein GCM10023195_75830 [Actinoallomurus liliacearum]|uniref:Uncharacterized protein n=1 Tax=Actinoallomurus liliacearum TaxID=1080073 RepID=A0ABP8TUR7_9ACTN